MRKSYWSRTNQRGRISGRKGTNKHVKVLKYLALIAVSNSINAEEFFNGIVEAWKKDESQCKKLTVMCRERTKNSAVLMFIDTHNTISQFPVPTTVFQGDKGQIEPYMKTLSSNATSSKESVNLQIKDLREGMKKVNLKVKVLEIPEPNVVYTRYGTKSQVTNVLVGDKTGTIRMCLWNGYINTVSKHDVIEIENGKVSTYQGELQLRIMRKGTQKRLLKLDKSSAGIMQAP